MRLYNLDGLSQGGGKDGPACLLEAWMSELPLMNPVLKAVLLLFLTRQLAGLFFTYRLDIATLGAERRLQRVGCFSIRFSLTRPCRKKILNPDH